MFFMVKTRMAPSPTGEFHIGGMRTLLYNYVLAKKNKGHFVLRIEDTDKERQVEGAVERLQEVIKAYGLAWDEGPVVGGPNAPYVQSERLDLYKKYATDLIEKGHAYYCFCTKERLDEMRKAQQDAHLPTTKYDRHCLGLTSEQIKKNLEDKVPYVVRLKVPSDRLISYNDLFLGKVEFPSNDVEDQILLKSDGFPTYHLAVVIDDHLMEITHILRGSEWLASTPKHVLLYEFFGWEMPETGHLPNLKEVGANKKMSKRFGDVAAVEFLKNGYLPEALLNFIMLLGWNPGSEQEVFSLSEFIDAFSLEHIHKTDLVAFDREKLLWFNGYYIRQLSSSDLYDKLVAWGHKWAEDLGIAKLDRDHVIRVLSLIKDRMKTLADFRELSNYFFTDPKVDLSAISKYSREEWSRILTGFANSFSNVDLKDWNKDTLEKISHGFIEAEKFTPKEAFMTLRVAVTGETATPPLFEVLELLGKQVVLTRIGSVVSQNSN
jgi:glutamyl-tRNA synthetase